MTFFMGWLRPDLSLFMIFLQSELVVFILLSREEINILIMGFSMQEVCHSWTGTVFQPPPSLPPSLPASPPQIIILYSVNLWPIHCAWPLSSLTSRKNSSSGCKT